MTNVSKIKYSNTTLDIKDSVARQYLTYTVFGTQTSSTSKLVGEIPVNELPDGLMIMYILPYDTSGRFSLEIRYNNGADTTGIVPIYINKDNVLTGSLGALSVLPLIYYPKGSISINGTQTTQDRWLCATPLIGWTSFE